MADRVHPMPLPASSPPPRSASPPPPANEGAATETTPLHPSFNPPPPPQPGTYIIQIPKDQVLRVPPPEQSRRYKKLSARPVRRRALRRACLWACAATVFLILLAGAFVGVTYLVFRPRAPSFSVSSLSIHGLDVLAASNATTSPQLSPEIDAGVRADNGRNRKVGIDYRGGGEVTVTYSGLRLAAGEWPAFYQPPKNVTVFLTTLRAKDVSFTVEERKQLATEQKARAVPLTVDVRVPVRIRFGKLRTWTVDVKARCEVTVDKLREQATATNRGCKAKVKVLWWWW